MIVVSSGTDYHAKRLASLFKGKHISAENIRTGKDVKLKFKDKDEIVIFCGVFAGTLPFVHIFYDIGFRKLVFYWVGSDVNSTWKNLAGLIDSYAYKHFTDSSYLKQELFNLGLERVQTLNIFTNSQYTIEELPKKCSFIIPLHAERERFFNLNNILLAAEMNRDCDFHFIGTSEIPYTRKNIINHGYVNAQQKKRLYKKCSALIRIPKHDGMPFCLIEAFQMGRYVIHSYPQPFVLLNNGDLHPLMIQIAYVKSQRYPYQEASEYYQKHFSREITKAGIEAFLKEGINYRSWRMGLDSFKKWRTAQTDKPVDNRILSKTVGKLRPYGKVLDIGCGNTYKMIIDKYSNIKEYYGIDPEVKNNGSKRIINGTGENIPFKDNEFDTVMAIAMLDQCQDTKKVIMEAQRVLKDNGKFCLSVTPRELGSHFPEYKTEIITNKKVNQLMTRFSNVKIKYLSDLNILLATGYKKKRNKFSFICPVYNGEKYIQQCIESMLNQTYLGYDIIIIDDGSTDKTLDIISPYIDKYGGRRIKVWTLDKNVGTGKAIDIGISHSDSKYVVIQAADDISTEDRLWEINKCIEQNNDPDIVYHGYYFYLKFGDASEAFSVSEYNYKETMEGSNDIPAFLTVKRSVAKRIKFKSRLSEDSTFILKASKKGYRFQHLDKHLYFYRQHEAQKSKHYDTKKVFNEILSRQSV
jgi:ubiquinone/menaquinone biosynthesis C-methylase UbiE